MTSQLLLPSISTQRRSIALSERPDSARSQRPASARSQLTSRSGRSSVDTGVSGVSRGSAVLRRLSTACSNLPLQDYTDLSIEVLHTVESFNTTLLDLKLEATQLKQLRVSPPLKQAAVVKGIFLKVSRVSGLGLQTFQRQFLDEIGNVRSISVRFFRALVALIYTVLAKPIGMWPAAENIFGNSQEQLRLLQDLAQAASDTAALQRGAFEEAKEAAKLVLSQVSLSERKEEREAARQKRIVMLRNTGAGPAPVPAPRRARTAGALVGLSRKASGLIDSEPARRTSVTCGEELFELDADEFDAEVFEKFQALLAPVKEDDVDTVVRELSLLNRPARKKEILDRSQQTPDYKSYWKVAVANMRRIRERNTQKVSKWVGVYTLR
ncbi:unnamed protein product [Prorocentrum cordatum]|uniref:Uncharacterized protein n=1 Tax=Prorocentrum cordatum TaxID=2364126 RepID=A0ABN9QVK8_9DINO|nr:unnamed protein product [Polarella glacialis]